MKRYQGIFATSELTRDRRLLTVSALASMLDKSWRKGTPSHIGHNLLRPAGWSNTVALLLEPGLAQVIGQYRIPETDDEFAEIAAACRNAEIEQRLRDVAPFRQELLRVVKGHTTGNGKFHFPGCPAFVEEGIAVSLCSSVFRLADHEGLVPLTVLDPVAPGVFRADKLLIFAHQYFRRSCSRENSLNEPILEYLMELASKGHDIRIRLDSDMVGLAGKYHRPIEFQYQRGPLFDDALPKIDPGVTVHSNSDSSKILTNIARAEFRWGDLSGKRSFECEEVVDGPTESGESDIYHCRYSHATLGDNCNPDHVDGAVRSYDPIQMERRRQTDLKRSPHATAYLKLWRIYGSIQVAQWKTCLVHYFRDNRLIAEYFEGRENVRETKTVIPVGSDNPKPAPFFPQADKFLRVAISYHVNSEFPGEGISIHALDRVGGHEGPITIIEQDCLEIVKTLQIAGHEVAHPREFHYVTFEDAVVNFPLFVHRGQTARAQLAAARRAFSEYCRARALGRGDVYLSLSIGLAYDDRLAVMSLVGLASRLPDLLELPNAEFPENSSSLNEWADSLYRASFETEPRPSDELYSYNYLQPSGLFRITRDFIDPRLFEIVHDEKKNDVWIKFRKECRTGSEIGWLESGASTAALAVDIIKAKCSRCGSDYHQCQCRRFIDEGVYQRIEKLELLGVVRTPIVRRAA